MPKPISPPPRLEVLQETPQEGLHRTSTFRTYLEQAVDDINNKYKTASAACLSSRQGLESITGNDPTPVQMHANTYGRSSFRPLYKLPTFTEKPGSPLHSIVGDVKAVPLSERQSEDVYSDDDVVAGQNLVHADGCSHPKSSSLEESNESDSTDDRLDRKYSIFGHIKVTAVGNDVKNNMAKNDIQGYPLPTNNISHYGQPQRADEDIEMTGSPSSIAVEAPPNSEADISVHTNPFTSPTLEEAAHDQDQDPEQPDNPFLDPMNATQLREEIMSPVEIPESSYDGHDWPQVESLKEMQGTGNVLDRANVVLASVARPPCLADELAGAHGYHGSKTAQPRNSSAPSVKALVDRYRGIEQSRIYPRPGGPGRQPDSTEKIIKSYRRDFSSETETSSDLSWEDSHVREKMGSRAVSGNPVVNCAGGWHANF